MTTTRSCIVCRIRETADYPFGDSNYCPKHHHYELRVTALDAVLLEGAFVSLMIERYGDGA